MITDFYNSTVSVERLNSVDDVYGGSTDTWTTNIESYDCRIYQPTGEMDITDIGKVEGTVYKCAGGNADIKINDKIVDGEEEYIVKKVTGIKKKSSTIDHLEMILSKIK